MIYLAYGIHFEIREIQPEPYQFRLACSHRMSLNYVDFYSVCQQFCLPKQPSKISMYGLACLKLQQLNPDMR